MRSSLKKLRGLSVLAACCLVSIDGADAMSKTDIDRMTTCATMLGRGLACGANVDEPTQRVARWMDRVAPKGSPDQGTYLLIFISGMEYHFERQKDGLNPDTCETINALFDTMPWP